MKYKVSHKEATEALDKVDERFAQLLQHDSMKVEYYAPQKVDLQTPHIQDELYIIISGTGNLNGNDIVDLNRMMFYWYLPVWNIAL